MSELLDLLRQQLGGDRVKRISEELDADETSTQSAMATALPLLIGGLSRNATSSRDQAQSLNTALEEDHDGSLLDNLGSLLGGSGGAGGGAGGLLGAAGSLLGGAGGRGGGAGGLLGALLGGGSRTTNSDAILRHVLGNKRAPVERGVSQASGLDPQKVSALLSLLAPVVMSALGRVKRQQNLGPDELTGLLNRERAEIEEAAPQTQRGGLLGLFDTDDERQVADTVAQLGGSAGGGLLGKLLGR